MEMQQRICKKIQQQLPNSELTIVNESHLHNTLPNSESHFKLIVVSDSFTGLMPVKRHQLIYQILFDELRDQVHALALHTYTISEWQQRGEQAPNSPNCRGEESL